MNKIKAIIKPMENVMYDIYFQDYVEDGIIINGGRDLKSFNDELLKDIKKHLDNYNYYNYAYYGFDSLKKYLNNYLPKDNKKSWAGNEIKRFKELSKAFCNCSGREEDNLSLDILNIITGKKYTCRTIYGYRESAHLILEESVDTDARLIRDITALYFGGAYELFFTSNEIETPEDIYEDYETMWVSDYNVKEIKETLAKWYDYLNVKPEDIILYEAKEKYVVKYDYTEV